MRLGLTETFELRGAFGWLNSNQASDENISGLSFLDIGFRYNVFNGSGSQPSVGIQTEFQLNTFDQSFGADEVAPRVLLLYTQPLNDRLSLSAVKGISWDGIRTAPSGVYTLNLGIALTGKLSTFLETYGNYDAEDFDIFFDTGLAYIMNDDLQLDLTLSYGLNDEIISWFTDVGLSWRFNWRD